MQQRVLGASVARNQTAARVGVVAASFIRRLGYPEWVTRVKNGPVARLLFKPIERSEYPRMSAETRLRLCDFFSDDVQRLGKRLDRDLVSAWFSNDP